MSINSSKRAGFTLVEVVAIAPLVLLIIGAMVAIIVTVTGAAMRSQAQMQLQNDVLAALDMIEQDTVLSTNIAPTSSGQINMDNLATDRNPADPARQLIRRSDCQAASSGLPSSEALVYWNAYWVSGGNLMRRANYDGKWCATGTNNIGPAWQKHNRNETIISGASSISMNITYDLLDGYTDRAKAQRVTITATKRVAGSDISYTGVMYARSLNVR